MPFVNPGTGALDRDISGSLASIDNKIVVGLPNTDVNNVEIPYVGARLQAHVTATNRWLSVCAFDPLNPDVPGTACGLWVRPIDYPDAIRVQVVDAVSGNSSLFFTGAPNAAQPGFAVRVVPSGPTALAAAQSIVFATDHPSVITREEPYTRTLFGQTRVATAYAMLDGVSTYGINGRQWATLTATGGAVAYETTPGVIALTVTAASGSRAVLRTHTYFLYQSGKALRMLMTVYHADAGQAGQVRRWGYFEDGDGLFFELSGTDLRVVRRSSVSGAPVDVAVEQADWNVDPLNGLGPSGVTLDVTKSSIYELDLQWLSAGTVRYIVNGIVVHVAEHANTLGAPYMRTAQLPVQAEVVNTGASTGSSMRVICACVHVDAGERPAMFGFSYARSATLASIGTTYLPVVSFRVAELFGGRQNRKVVLPERLFIANSSGKAYFKLLLNATLTGAAWVDVNAGASGVQYDETATAVSGGSVILTSYLSTADGLVEVGGNNFFSLLGNHLRCPAFGGVGDVFTIAARAKVGTTDIDATAAWFEVG